MGKDLIGSPNFRSTAYKVDAQSPGKPELVSPEFIKNDSGTNVAMTPIIKPGFDSNDHKFVDLIKPQKVQQPGVDDQANQRGCYSFKDSGLRHYSIDENQPLYNQDLNDSLTLGVAEPTPKFENGSF